MVFQGFHIRVMFVSHGFDVIVNVVDIILLQVRRDRRGRRENSKCLFGGCKYGACVCVGRHCEKCRLVGIVF